MNIDDIPSVTRFGYLHGGTELAERLLYPHDNFDRSHLFPYSTPTSRNQSVSLKSLTTFSTNYTPYDLGLLQRFQVFIDTESKVWVGTISKQREEAWHSYFITQDGQIFDHYCYAETYLKNRYWVFGDPPQPNIIMRWRINGWKQRMQFS